MNLMANLIGPNRLSKYCLQLNEQSMVRDLRALNVKSHVLSHNMIKLTRGRKAQIFENIKEWGMQRLFTQ